MMDQKSGADKKLIQYLRSLEAGQDGYPESLHKKRRLSYQHALAGMSGLLPVTGIVRFFKSLLPRTTEGILQAVLAGSIVAVAGTTAYLFRHEIADWLNPVEPTPMVMQYQLPPTATLTSTPTPTATETGTLVATPMVKSTDSGHHYGQTRTPKP